MSRSTGFGEIVQIHVERQEGISAFGDGVGTALGWIFLEAAALGVGF
jgi:hypothetical protein